MINILCQDEKGYVDNLKRMLTNVRGILEMAELIRWEEIGAMQPW